jgi:hypothetical protein
MPQIKISDVICQLTNIALKGEHSENVDWNTRKSKAVGYAFDLRTSYYPDDEDDVQSVSICRNVVFVLAPSTSVFVAVLDWSKDEDRAFNYNQIPLDKFENTSNHDSCWRSDGVEYILNDIENDMHKALEEHYGRKINRRDCHKYNNFMSCFETGQELIVEHTADESKDNSYWRKLTKLEIVK